MTPHLYVDLLSQPMRSDVKSRIAEAAAEELLPGEIVNLGIGIPNLIPGFLTADSCVVLHTENGLLGVGPRPVEDELDPDLIHAAKQPVTALPGASYFDSADELRDDPGRTHRCRRPRSARGERTRRIANWAVPGEDVLGVGGAMDLVVGARRVIVDDDRHLVPRRAEGRRRMHLPTTAAGAVDVISRAASVFRV